MAGSEHFYLQKGIRSAEQATVEDKAQNYEIAAQHYMTAADWLMQAIKYEEINAQGKQIVQSRVNSYLKRAEEIKETLMSGPVKKNAIVDDDDDVQDKKRIMQKYEGAIVTNPKVTFADVIGLEQAKEALKEAVILPVKFPQLFQGGRKPWPGILLYGPPGTGKSYLAKALATECKSTFISVSSSYLLLGWFDESEKGVRYLFELARERQPCILFIDDIDDAFGRRNDSDFGSIHQRIKAEFLIQMSGINKDTTSVFVLAATSSPWKLDGAIRRRFARKIYIPLPCVDERVAMFKTHLGADTHHTIKENEWMQLAQKSEHYSAIDIALVCREVLLRPIRRLGSATHFKRVSNPKSDGPPELWFACSPGDSGAETLILDEVKSDELCEPPVTISDMLAALTTQKATVGEADLLLHKQFTEEYGP